MLTCAQIFKQVGDICKTPSFATDFDNALIYVLSEMCETYDWEETKVSFNGTLSTTVKPVNPNIIAGQGPQNLPTNYLRMIPRTFLYYINGTPYPLINFDDEDYDIQIQQVGIASLARNYITDLSNPTQAVFFVYPPTNGAYPYQGRCRIRMPDVGSGAVAATGWSAGALAPHLSTVIPWFPNTSYLVTRIAEEMMMVSGDTRRAEFEKKGQRQLNHILSMKDDREARSQRIQFDRRRFGPRYASLPDTKIIWG